MGITRIVHYGVDLALVAMVLAGLRRSTGLVVAYEMSDLKNYIRRYLNWGEYLFDKLAQMAEKSYYFRKETALDGFLDSIFKRYQKFSKSHGDFTRLEVGEVSKSDPKIVPISDLDSS